MIQTFAPVFLLMDVAEHIRQRNFTLVGINSDFRQRTHLVHREHRHTLVVGQGFHNGRSPSLRYQFVQARLTGNRKNQRQIHISIRFYCFTSPKPPLCPKRATGHPFGAGKGKNFPLLTSFPPMDAVLRIQNRGLPVYRINCEVTERPIRYISPAISRCRTENRNLRRKQSPDIL